jgi:hypothetical protein
MKEDLAGRRLISRLGARRLARLPWALLLLSVLAAAQAWGQGAPSPSPTPGHAFEGSWSGTGTVDVVPMGSGMRTLTFHLSGALVLTSQQGLDKGYRCIIIGFDDGRGLTVGSCVWVDEHGDKIFSDLRGESVVTGKHIRGTIIGGSGRYAGLTGEFEFDWSYVIVDREGAAQGWAEKLTGRVYRPPAKVSPK